MTDTDSFPVDPCSGATPGAAADQAPDLSRSWGSRPSGKAMGMLAGETELRRFQVPATRIRDGSHGVVLVIQRTSSWSIYGADEEGVQLSDASMTILARAIVKYSNDTDPTV